MFWDVPATGGYMGGYETGEAMALAFAKFLREESGDYAGGALTHIVGSFMERYEDEGGKEMEERPVPEQSHSSASLRGQYVGFFNTIAKLLRDAAQRLGGEFDRTSERELLQRANSGLGFDEAACIASFDDER